MFLSCPVFECLYEGTRGGGKRINDNESILTNIGWKRVGDVTYKDKLVAPDGAYTDIISIAKQSTGALYRITFEDGATIECDGPHRWNVRSAKNGYRDGWLVRTTDELIDLLKQSAGKSRSEKNSWYIPTCQAMPGNEYNGHDPYVIGLMLGDGTTGSKNAVIYNQDEFILQYMEERHGWVRYKYGDAVARVVCTGTTQSNAWKDATGRFKGADKRIPQVILKADPQTRLACLQGLMDSDGSIDKEGRITFDNCALQLIKGAQYIVRSLGGKAHFNPIPEQRTTKLGSKLPIYRLKITPCNKFNPFRLPRKAERVKHQNGEHRRIESITPVPSGPATCFAVAHPSHQFVCQDFIVTHNTDCLLMDFAKEIGKGYGAAWRGILFRKTYKQLADIVAKTKKWFPRIFGKAAQWNQGDYYWHWPTGEMLLLRHWARDDDYENYHGHEYSWLGLEELCNWAMPTILTKMTSTVRCSDTVLGASIPMRIRATTNPYGPGHGWVKQRYSLHLPIRERRVMRNLTDKNGNALPDRVSIHSDIRENLILLRADPNYISKLRASCRSEAERKAWIEGSWDIVAGGMFDDLWQSDVHSLTPFDVPRTWRIKPSFDWGSSHPFSIGWWAISDGSDVRLRTGQVRTTVRKDLFRIREWYGCQKDEINVGLKITASEIAKGMVERQLEWGMQDWVTKGIADAAIFSVENGHSVAADMEKEIIIANCARYPGIKWTPSDKKSGSRKLGWQAIRQRMENSIPPKDGRPRERSGIFIFSHYCQDWIRTVLTLPRDPDDMDDVDTDAEDHAADETRYFVYSQGNDVGEATRIGP